MAANYDWLKLVQNANGGPLPLVTDPLAGQYGALQQDVGTRQGTAQDTGWSSTPTPTSWMSIDYGNPPGTGGQQGASASGTGGGSSAWNLPGWAYGGNQKGGGTYNAQTGQWDNGAPLAAGSDIYGAKLPVGYNSANDRGGLELNGQAIETFWSRALRFARDFTMGGTDPTTALQMAIDRIRRDNGGTLQGTGFEEGQAVTPTQQGGARGQTTTTAPAGQTGGSEVNPLVPQMGSGLQVGGQSAASTQQPGGNPASSLPQNSIGGSAGGIDQLYQNNQAYRTAQLLKALGLGDVNSQMSYGGSVIAQQAPGLFEAWREAQGAGGGGLPNDMGQLGAFANIYNSQGGLGNIAQTGQQGLNWLMGQGGQGLHDTEMIPLIQAFEQLANLRQSDTMQRYYGNLTDQGVGQFLKGINAGNVTSARLAPFLQSNPLFHFLTGQR